MLTTIRLYNRIVKYQRSWSNKPAKLAVIKWNEFSESPFKPNPWISLLPRPKFPTNVLGERLTIDRNCTEYRGVRIDARKSTAVSLPYLGNPRSSHNENSQNRIPCGEFHFILQSPWPLALRFDFVRGDSLYRLLEQIIFPSRWKLITKSNVTILSSII